MKYIPILFLFAALSLPSYAEDHGHNGLVPVMSQEIAVADNVAAINLSMDKSELVRLNQNAASIIVGNPVHASVLMDSPKLLVVVPRAPGATHFTVLNNEGQIILQRHIIVAAPTENYVRVRSAVCAEDDETCGNTQTYYCPDMCHEIMSDLKEDASSNSEETSADNAAGTSGGQGAQETEENP